ncbi:MAG: PPC domain-containing DNA-binding protein [Planctomycetota bacterium]|jgi:predicted DNA-binding protein with PD1-like motif
MKHSEGHVGRVFILRLEDGDEVPSCIERFAADEGIRLASVTLIGGIGSGEVVVGPRDSDSRPIEPVKHSLENPHEVLGTGLLAPGPDGEPMLHIHGALGRGARTVAGCLRPGVGTWLTGEAVVTEILDSPAARVADPDTGLALLEPNG